MANIGIYKIENKINGNVYIGQSLDVFRRWSTHANINKVTNKVQVITKAIAKHGVESFTFEVLELCSKASLNEREVFWIAKFNSYQKGYNCTTGGDTPEETSGSKLTRDKAKIIQNALIADKVTIKQLAQEYGVAESTISSVNTGNSWFDEGLSYPLRSGHGVYLKSLEAIREQNKVPAVQKKAKLVYHCNICGQITRKTKSGMCKVCIKVATRKVTRPSKVGLIGGILNNSQTALGKRYGVSANTIKKWCKAYNIPYNRKDFNKFVWCG